MKRILPKFIYVDDKVFKLCFFDKEDVLMACRKCAFYPHSCSKIPFECYQDYDGKVYNFYFVESHSLRAKLFKLKERLSTGGLRPYDIPNEDLDSAKQYLDKIYKFNGVRFRSIKCSDCRVCDLRHTFIPYCQFNEPCQVKEGDQVESWVYRAIDHKVKLKFIKLLNTIRHFLP